MTGRGKLVPRSLVLSLLLGLTCGSAHGQFARDGWEKLTPTEPALGGQRPGSNPYPPATDGGASRGALVPLPSPVLLGAAGFGLVIGSYRRRRS